jgi:TorA maturation chaperone TorD
MGLTETTIGRASIYGLLAGVFAYPDDTAIQAIRNGSKSVISVIDSFDSDKSFRQAAFTFTRIATKSSDDELRRHYSELMVGRRQCHLDESEYDKAIFNRYQRLADVAGFYRAFGFNVSNCSRQRPDFIGTELEFMQVLLLKRAYAEEQGWNTETQTCVSAESIFIGEHLEWWVKLMCKNLRGDETCTFHTSLSNFLEHFVRTEGLRYMKTA